MDFLGFTKSDKSTVDGRAGIEGLSDRQVRIVKNRKIAGF